LLLALKFEIRTAGGSMKYFRTLLTCLLVCLLAGCGVAAPFIQSGVAKDNSAHIITDSDNSGHVAGWSQRVYIFSIDGVPTHSGPGLRPEEAYVSAGLHRFDVQYWFMGTNAKSSLELDAKANHTYVVRWQIDGGRMRFWFTDGWDGPTVGGVAD